MGTGDASSASAAGQGELPGDLNRLEADVVLADGGTVHVRPIRPDDGAALVRFHGRLSPQSIYLRYFSGHPTLSPREVVAPYQRGVSGDLRRLR